MSGDAGWPYDVLDLNTRTTDPKEIKKAYARRLKSIDQANDQEAFAALRGAYEAALHHTRPGQRRPKPETEVNPVAPRAKSPPSPLHFDASGEVRGARRPIKPDETEILHAALADTSNPLATRIQHVMSSPAMNDPDVAQAMEYPIYKQLVDNISNAGDRPHLNLGPLGKTTLGLLDNRYNWLSDYRSTVQRLPDYTNFLIAADGTLSPTSSIRKRQDVPKPRFRGLRSGWTILWVLIVVSAIARLADGVGTSKPDPIQIENSFAVASMVDLVADRQFVRGQTETPSAHKLNILSVVATETGLPPELTSVDTLRRLRFLGPDETVPIAGATSDQVAYVAGILTATAIAEDLEMLNEAMQRPVFGLSDGKVKYSERAITTFLSDARGYVAISPQASRVFAQRSDFVSEAILRSGSDLRRLEGTLGLLPGSLDRSDMVVSIYPRGAANGMIAVFDHAGIARPLNGSVHKTWPLNLIGVTKLPCRTFPVSELTMIQTLECP